MIRQRMIAGLAATTILVGLTACGSDTKSSSTTEKAATTTAATATTKPATATTKPATPTTKPATPTTKAVTASTGGPSSTADASDDTDPDVSDTALHGDCVKYQDEYTQLSSGDSLDPDQVSDFLDELKGDVPSDLEDDVATLKGALVPFAKAMQTAGTDQTKALSDPAVQQAMTALSDPKVQAAGDAMDKWFSDGCPG